MATWNLTPPPSLSSQVRGVLALHGGGGRAALPLHGLPHIVLRGLPSHGRGVQHRVLQRGLLFPPLSLVFSALFSRFSPLLSSSLSSPLSSSPAPLALSLSSIPSSLSPSNVLLLRSRFSFLPSLALSVPSPSLLPCLTIHTPTRVKKIPRSNPSAAARLSRPSVTQANRPTTSRLGSGSGSGLGLAASHVSDYETSPRTTAAPY